MHSRSTTWWCVCWEWRGGERRRGCWHGWWHVVVVGGGGSSGGGSAQPGAAGAARHLVRRRLEPLPQLGLVEHEEGLLLGRGGWRARGREDELERVRAEGRGLEGRRPFFQAGRSSPHSDPQAPRLGALGYGGGRLAAVVRPVLVPFPLAAKACGRGGRWGGTRRRAFGAHSAAAAAGGSRLPASSGWQGCCKRQRQQR